MHMWEGRRTKVTFPPQTHIRSFKHLTVHNDDVRITTIGVHPLLILLSRFFNNLLDARDCVVYIMLDGWPNPEPQAFAPCPAGPR